MGWGKKALAFYLFVLCSFSFSADEKLTCGDAFSQIPKSAQAAGENTKELLLKSETLNPQIRIHLEKGGSLQDIPRPPETDVKSDNTSKLSSSEEERLKHDIAYYTRLYLKNPALRRCLLSTAILLSMSTAVTSGAAVQDRWETFADPDTPYLEGAMSTEMWNRAVHDPDFRHQVEYNAILMSVLGSASCLANEKFVKNQKQWRNSVALVAAGTSVVSQLLSSGHVSLRQTVTDTLFVRYISVNKTSFVLGFVKSYSGRGLPRARALEAAMQGVSEVVGAVTYPKVVKMARWLWPNSYDPDYSSR